MKLKKMLNGLEYELIEGSLDIEVEQIIDNSNIVTKNGLFFAISGANSDGHIFIEQAIINGCRVIVLEKKVPILFRNDVSVIKVANTRYAMSLISKNFYLGEINYNNVKFIAVTGTNGKTTTTFMFKSILNRAGFDVGIIGTSGIFFNNEILRGEALTTPDPIDLFEYIKKLLIMGVDYILLEVSAHALYYNKTDGIYFDYSIFTNLTEDHLDFFGDMENYGKAKKMLFDKTKSKFSIINTDDKFGAIIYKTANNFAYSIGCSGNYKLIHYNKKCDKFIINANGTKKRFILNMGGIYNIYNALGVIAVCLMENIPNKYIYNGLKYLPSIAGRYNVYNMGQHGRVVLDFAHTPDGLENVLKKAKLDLKKSGKLISVFGCGGNRDVAKRPIMGMIAGRFADYTIISIDNPRFENATKVMSDVEEGIKKITNSYEICMPRSYAIKKAINMCKKNDIVVVSGKGVEPYYEENGIKHFYREDREIIKVQKSLGIKISI